MNGSSDYPLRLSCYFSCVIGFRSSSISNVSPSSRIDGVFMENAGDRRLLAPCVDLHRLLSGMKLRLRLSLGSFLVF